MKFKNLPEFFFKRSQKYGEKIFQRYKNRNDEALKNISWREAQTSVEEIAFGLRRLGAKHQENIGLLAITCHQWLHCDLGIMSMGAVTVPLYHNATSDQVKYIINHSEIKIIFVRNKIQLQKIRSMWSEMPSLEYVIVIEDKGDIPPNDPKLITLEHLKKIGREDADINHEHIKKVVAETTLDETASIIYTSGTTGVPKGVVLSHRNILASALSFYQYAPLEENFNILSFLPLAHVFERVASQFYGIDQGCTITYCQKAEDLINLMLESKCNLLFVVPRILEKIHYRITSQVNNYSGVKKAIINAAFDLGIEYMRRKFEKKAIPLEMELRYQAAKATIFKSIKNKIASHLKLMVVGGAPFSKELSYFFHALGFNIIEGYGLTETSSAVCVNPIWENRPGTVGPPFGHFEIKIAQDGELLCRGDSVFSAYYKNPEATENVFITDEDGKRWFCTGDLAAIDDHGYIQITGRKKDLIITAGGKNISPSHIEHTLLKSPYLNQVIVLGDKEKYLASLVVVSEADIKSYFVENQIIIEAEYQKKIHEHPKVYELIEKEINKYNAELARYEQIKTFAILEKELTIEDGELTPTLKVKRNVVREKYKEVIQPLFNKSKPE